MNALAEAQTIVVSAHAAGDSVEISLADDGKGFDTDSSDGPGRGLRNIQTRARDHGIELAVSSERGSGTTVVMRLALPEPGNAPG